MINSKTNARESMAFLDDHVVWQCSDMCIMRQEEKVESVVLTKEQQQKKSTDTKCLQKAERLSLTQVLNTPRLLS